MSDKMLDMSERVSQDMSDRMSECQTECQEICEKEYQKECQKICQKECEKIASSQSVKLRVTGPFVYHVFPSCFVEYFLCFEMFC